MAKRKQHGFLKALLALFAIAAIAAYFIFYFDFYALFDRFKAQNFQPTSEVASLEVQLNLTERGKNLYYALNPQIESAQNFNRDCSDVSGVESGFLLGCYKTNLGKEKIAVFNAGATATAAQKQLFDYDSSKIVTMAHEILHGAYNRRHWYQSKPVDRELKQISRQIQNDCTSSSPLSIENCKTIKSDMKSYSKITPSELYARLGSEISLEKLPKNLAQDYQKYFIDTVKIVSGYTKNRQQEQDIKASLENMRIALEQSKQNVDNMTANYYRYPTYDSYYSTTAAINQYNRSVEEYNEFVKLYNSTFIEQLDSKTTESFKTQ